MCLMKAFFAVPKSKDEKLKISAPDRVSRTRSYKKWSIAVQIAVDNWLCEKGVFWKIFFPQLTYELFSPLNPMPLRASRLAHL